jgi:hypothetical protein
MVSDDVKLCDVEEKVVAEIEGRRSGSRSAGPFRFQRRVGYDCGLAGRTGDGERSGGWK